MERSKFYQIIDDDSEDENTDEEEAKTVNEEHEGGCVDIVDFSPANVLHIHFA